MSELLILSQWPKTGRGNKPWVTSFITVGLLHLLIVGFLIWKPIDNKVPPKYLQEGTISLELAPEITSSQSVLSSRQAEKTNQQMNEPEVKKITPPPLEDKTPDDLPISPTSKSDLEVRHEPKKLPSPRKRTKEEIPKKPVNKTQEQTKQHKAQQQTTSQAANTAVKQSVAQAPVTGSSQAATVAKDNWQNQVMAQLEKAKRYPAYAIRQNQQDVVLIHFAIDRSGKLLNSHIVNSQGFQLLDQEAKNLLERTSPLPRPPSSVQGSVIEMEVPIVFFIQK
ncbi:energy transducer TonB [Serratia liquefaciens]|uniref:energy transducer TonB n=1 Tax=Serratia liquefaciens TaxID=614 RepID=UPI00101FDE99|nr:energy transducer TonB [Serratia liquefaciens]RYM70454.1 hypothetical protein BSQ99_15095 [Serratia liquefaciens]